MGSWTCREDFGIERNQSFKEDYDNAQFSLCCTSTAMPDGDSQDRHPAFLFFRSVIPSDVEEFLIVSLGLFALRHNVWLHPGLRAPSALRNNLIPRTLQFALCLCTFRFASKNFNAAFPM